MFGFFNYAFSEENKNDSESRGNLQTKYFKSINRFQYIQSLNAQSVFAQGSFIILPHGFTAAELLELYSDIESYRTQGFENFIFGIKLARYVVPDLEWGRAFSWVVRYQDANGFVQNWGAGLQWNISETPGLIQTSQWFPWKALFQVFAKNEKETGTTDMYLWFQVPIIRENRLYIRGMSEYYFLPDERKYFDILADLIVPISERLEMFSRYEFQNIEFLNKSLGSKYGLGIRIAY